MKRSYIDASELCHRLCNGFISHDGYVDGEFVDVFKNAGIEFDQLCNPETPYGLMIELVVRIIESIPTVDMSKLEDENSELRRLVEDED